MASLKQRKNTWFAVWYQSGKQIVKSTGVKIEGELTKARQKQLALATAQSMEAAAKGALTVNAAIEAVRAASVAAGASSTVPTVKEYLERYEPSGRLQNVSNGKRACARFLAYAVEHHNTRLDALPVATCREWLQSEARRVAISTVEKYKKDLSAAFNKAIRDEIITRNPFTLIRMPEVKAEGSPPITKRLPFTIDEMRRLMTDLPSPWREMVTISFYTGGQRIGDVARMRWESVDMEARVITLRTSKTGRELSTPMTQELYECLASLRSSTDKGAEYVLPSMADRYRRQQSTLSTEFTGLLRGMGIIPPLSATVKSGRDERKAVAVKSFHSIRHTVVSLLRSSAMVSADLARAIVGHESEEIERAYFTASQDAKMEGLAVLARAVKEE